MLSRLERWTSNKPYYWFWFLFDLVFAILTLSTGGLVLSLLFVGFTVYWGWVLYTTYKGTNRLYNKYHSKGLKEKETNGI